MNVLIVCAHFDANSFNASLLAATTRRLEAFGHKVRVSDLYAMRFQPVTLPEDFSDPENPAHIRYDTEQRHAAAKGRLPADVVAELEKIDWCDLMILQFPWYWFGLPAILKGWVHRVFAMGVAYGGGKWYERGAFSGRKAILNFSTGCFPGMCGPDGIRLRADNQNRTVAARIIALKKALGHRSYRVAPRLQSFKRPNILSMRLRRRSRRLSYLTGVSRVFLPGMQGVIPLFLSTYLKQSAS
ncbi:flavodoxin family protein [Falsigemmobacter faecalis]|uniref:Flavodoxin family protein n=1 Tax=Falsigemmobacter faecalis TaxID=2488730 RepID=A0A3P3DQK1_9RHOB|nr:flavodoxin family protein [Falsigemmobacter faecalis]